MKTSHFCRFVLCLFCRCSINWSDCLPFLALTDDERWALLSSTSVKNPEIYFIPSAGGAQPCPRANRQWYKSHLNNSRFHSVFFIHPHIHLSGSLNDALRWKMCVFFDVRTKDCTLTDCCIYYYCWCIYFCCEIYLYQVEMSEAHHRYRRLYYRDPLLRWFYRPALLPPHAITSLTPDHFLYEGGWRTKQSVDMNQHQLVQTACNEGVIKFFI